MKLQLDITPEQMAALRLALAPTPAEIEAVALALVARMRSEQMQASATMTVAEFARQARVTPNHVRKLIRAGKIEATSPGGGDMRITAAAAAAYFAGGKHGNGQ